MNMTNRECGLAFPDIATLIARNPATVIRTTPRCSTLNGSGAQTHYYARASTVQPDLAPYDFYLFLELKIVLMGTHFQSAEGKNGRFSENGDTL
ncbi:hypothetical protein TNCV_3459211 [Trichonephila clavipes]|nr:hypothetical protein TNCV_3459211 [Trichonephila clavipes]